MYQWSWMVKNDLEVVFPVMASVSVSIDLFYLVNFFSFKFWWKEINIKSIFVFWVLGFQDDLQNKYQSTKYTISIYSAQNTLFSLYIYVYKVAMYV